MILTVENESQRWELNNVMRLLSCTDKMICSVTNGGTFFITGTEQPPPPQAVVSVVFVVLIPK